MKVDKIRLENFRSYPGKNEVNGLEKINVFLGLNGSGKSTIADALCFAFTGTCRGTDQGGRGADKLISRNSDGKPISKGFQVVLETEKGEIARTLGAGPNSKFQETVNQLVGPRKGRNTMAIQVALQPHVFLTLSPTEQKALLLSVVGSEIDKEAVKEQLGSLAKFLPPGALESLQMLDAAESNLRGRRPQVKRAISELVVPNPPDTEIKIPKGMTAKQAVKKASDQITGMRVQRDTLLTGKRVAETAIATQKKVLGSVVEQEKTIRGKMSKLLSEKEIVDGIKAGTAKLEKAEANTAALDKKRQALTSSVEAAIHTASALKAMLSVKGVKVKLCDKCAPRLKKIVKEKEEEAQELSTSLSNLPTASGSKKKIEEDLNFLYDAGEEVHRLKNELTVLAKQREEAEKIQIPDVPDPEKQADDVRKIEAGIAKGENYVGRLQKILFSSEQADEIRTRRTQLEEELAQVEALIKRIGPGGDVRTQLLKPGLGELEKNINAILSQAKWGDVELSLSDKAVEMKYQPPQTNCRMDADMLSSSERYRLSLCVAAAIAKRAGLGILCLDEAELLVGENKNALMVAVNAAKLDQVFVFMSATKPTLTSIPGWGIYTVSKDKGKSAAALN